MKLFRISLLTLCAITLISCGGAEERKAAYLEKARVSMEAGDLDKARIELKNVLQIDPKDAEARYELGKVFEKQNNFQKAFGNYLAAEELNPDLLPNQAKLGRMYLLMANQSEKVNEKIEYILSREPENADGLLLKAAQFVKNEKKAEAVKVLEQNLQKHPVHIDSLTLITSLYAADDRMADAKDLLEKALQSSPDNEQLNKLYGFVLVKNKDYASAEEIYKKFLERNPDSIASYNNLAAFYNTAGEPEKAEETLRSSIANDQDDVERQIALVRYISSHKGRDAAIEELKSLIEKNKGMGKLRIGLAELLFLNGDKDQAIDVYNDAVKDFSDEETGIDARNALASIYINERDYTSANDVVNEAIKVSPNDPKVNFLKAKLALRDRDLEQAIISLRIVTKETPDNVESFLLLANVYKLEGNTEQEKRTLNTAYDQNRTNSDGLLQLAKFHLSKDIAQAEKIIDDYNSIKHDDYEGLSIKAVILNQKKEFSEANQIAEKLLTEFPDKPNGYLQTIPYLNSVKNKAGAIATLEKGYIGTEDNRKILILLSALQTADKQYEIVEKRLNAEIKANPDDSQLRVMLSKVYSTQNKLTHAEKTLEEAITISPASEESYLLLSQIYLSSEKTDEAKSILIKGEENVTASLKIPFRLAELYEQENNYEGAINVYRQLNKTNPENLIIANNLASMLTDYGNNKEDLDMALKLSRELEKNDQPVFLDTVGWANYKNGDYDKAIEYLSKATKKAADVNIFNYHLGMAYKMAGDKVNAKTYLEKSLDNSGQFKLKSQAEEALKGL